MRGYKKKLLNIILNNAAKQKVLAGAFKDIHKAQLDSLNQKHTTNKNKLIKYTKNKGGYTALLYVATITPKLTKI